MTETTHTLQLIQAKIEGRIKALEELRVQMTPQPLEYDSRVCLKIFTLQSVLDDVKELLKTTLG